MIRIMYTGAITAMVTPFMGEGNVLDVRTFEALVRRQFDAGIKSIVIGGTTGESPTLTEEELFSLFEVASKEVRLGESLILGTGSNSTEKSVYLTQKAKEVGADAALIIFPYYNKPTFKGLYRHILALSKVGIDLILYHHPGRTGVSCSAKELVSLLNIDNVVALKECSGSLSLKQEILSIMPEAILLTGNDEEIISCLKIGVKGSISIISNLFPLQWCDIMHKGLLGDLRGSKEVFETIKPILLDVLSDVNPQGIKCALAAKELLENRLRLPMVPSEDHLFLQLKYQFEALSLSMSL